jgi:uncharacterized protein (DUF305 family)
MTEIRHARTASLTAALIWTLATATGSRAQDAQAVRAEAPFVSQNDAAMTKMMAGMDVKPTGDVDADFVAMMVPHHQGAIDMAVAELRYGHSEQLRRIAQEIIVDQQQEIAAMRLALGQPLPPSAPAPTQGAAPVPEAPAAAEAAHHHHSAMTSKE